ncbi:uncharacterized protein PgNI_08464 [Pyricularia grisea]|uniref:Uncharacterized protein n=1 Tax=Pyricularia grisea TaxID=148305 RepID=A0A6P8AUD0_PYRGI|nr:uncharacterized protein PgNI_08464 [Pyricularia grisea]TLD05769.1 hypothetical protein PgNI_08464 [Pyricularia grisea]
MSQAAFPSTTSGDHQLAHGNSDPLDPRLHSLLR